MKASFEARWRGWRQRLDDVFLVRGDVVGDQRHQVQIYGCNAMGLVGLDSVCFGQVGFHGGLIMSRREICFHVVGSVVSFALFS
jgi:hypothetical protein